MSHEIGGTANKLGNRYEGRWIAKQLLRMLNEDEISAVTVEPISDKEYGIDLAVTRKGKPKQSQQCKSRYKSANNWTLGRLNDCGVLAYMKEILKKEPNSEYVLVSPLNCISFMDLCNKARGSSGCAKEFYNHQIKRTRKKDSVTSIEKSFDYLCTKWEIDPATESDLEFVYRALRRIRFVTYPDDESELSNLRFSAGYTLTGTSDTALSVLLNYVENDNYSRPIYANELWTHLKENHDIFPKQQSYDERLAPRIEQLQSRFSESISSTLIKNELLPREETKEILSRVEDIEDTVVTAPAGCGKSVVLYQLTNELTKLGIPFLPLQLNKHVPESTARAFGESLGLTGSPVSCLLGFAAGRSCVLVLDQLDSIRWTSKHSYSSMSVCKEILAEIRGARVGGQNISVVFACRSFDLENDPEIKKFLTGKTNHPIRQISISELGDEVVAKVTGEAYGNMSTKQQRMLACPQNLLLWTRLQESQYGVDFETPVQLMCSFWKYLQYKLDDYHGVSIEEYDGFLNSLLSYMSSKGRYYAPKRLVEKYPNALEAMLSLEVIIEDSGIMHFTHQSYYDYLIAKKQYDSMILDPDHVLAWLGERKNHTFFRREQLRIILFLLADIPEDLIAVSRVLISSDIVRFHLKHLVLEVMGQIREISDVMLDFCLELESDPFWRCHIQEVVYRGHCPWIRSIHERVPFSTRLSSEDDSRIGKALGLLRSIAESAPDLVTSILVPFESTGDEWNNRILRTICREPEYDSDSMFDLRLRLARAGYIDEHIRWKKLSERYPLRVLQYIEVVVSTWEYDDEDNLQISKSLSIYEEEGYTALKHAVSEYPDYAWHTFIVQAKRLVSNIMLKNDKKILSWNNDSLSSETNANAQNFLGLVEHAGSVLAERSPSVILRELQSSTAAKSIVIDRLLMKIACKLDKQYSNQTMSWLMKNTSLFSVGNGNSEHQWSLARRLIQTFSVSCSDALHSKLEHVIYYFHESNEKQLAQHYLSSWKEGWYDSFWGKCQYFLLPALDASRMSESAKQLSLVLQRKFDKYPKNRFLNRYSSGGGRVESKLKPNLEKISNKSWLKLLGNDESIITSRRNWVSVSPGVILDSSISLFANSLREITYRFPNRFAQLALDFPDDVNPAYISAVFDGCSLTEPVKDKVPEDEVDFWEPVSADILERLIWKYYSYEDAVTARSLCYMIESRADETWSEKTIKKLLSYACNHPDPIPNELHVHSNLTADKASISILRTNALNCVRGAAILTVAKLLWKREELYQDVEDVVKSSILDPHPVVKIAALRLIYATINIDRDKAWEWYLAICQDDLRLPASPIGLKILEYCMYIDVATAKTIIMSMVYTEDEEISRIGAEVLASYWIVQDIFKEELFANIAGAISIRRGFVQAGMQYLDEAKYREKSLGLLMHFVDDADDQVRSEMHSVLVKREPSISDQYSDFLIAYVKSKAFHDERSHFLYDLSKYEGCVLPLAEVILSISEEVVKRTSQEPDYRYLHSYQCDIVTNILVRLYQELDIKANKELINRIHNCWDDLLMAGVGRVAELVKKIDE